MPPQRALKPQMPNDKRNRQPMSPLPGRRRLRHLVLDPEERVAVWRRDIGYPDAFELERALASAFAIPTTEGSDVSTVPHSVQHADDARGYVTVERTEVRSTSHSPPLQGLISTRAL